MMPKCDRCGKSKRVRVREVQTPGRPARILYCPCRHRLDAAAWIERNPANRAAHKAVEKTIKRGLLARQACEVCGTEAGEAHHDDYAEPLEVCWLCRKHHVERHRQTNLSRFASRAANSKALSEK